MAESSVPEFNADEVHNKWNQAFTTGKLEEELRQHWRQFVPVVFSAKIGTDNTEDVWAEKFLFNPMELFVCGDKPEKVFKRLQELDNMPQFCGKVFKLGEPTYSCRDCSADNTCVLCIDCFQNSNHKTHRYKMRTSGGGGYCDCGDEEAWKSHPFCTVHQKGNESVKSDPVELMPIDLRERARGLFLATMQYALEMLTLDCSENPSTLPADFHTDSKGGFVTMLFNDEVHTYDQVISSLQKAVGASHKEAVDFATTVDREGRSQVKYGTIDECNKAKDIIVKNSSRSGSKPLKVYIMHTSVVAHQIFAMKILSWLQSVSAKTEGLCKMFCLLILEESPLQTKSVVERFLLSDVILWKSARVQTHQLFMSGILKDQECKRRFAILFTKIYSLLMEQFKEDDHDRSVCAVSESVQIFTVPTLARMLIAEQNLLQVILNTFLEECKSKLKDDLFSFDKHDRQHSFKRSQYALYDFKYALTGRPSAEDWTDDLRTNFINGFESLLTVLKFMHGMDCVKRQTGQHIEFEPEWEGAFNLQLKLEDCISIMVDWCGTDRDVLLMACNSAIKMLEEKEAKQTPFKYIDHNIAKHIVSCINYNVSKEAVSIHAPLTRILASLVVQCSKYEHAMHDVEALIRTSALSVEQLIEPSLRCLVMIAQTQANMWKRNGYALLSQIYFYHNVRCRSQMYDCDIIMLQAGAAIMEPNHFIVHLISKFGLHNWIREDYDNTSQDELLRQIIVLAEEFLNLLIIILIERYVPGLADVTKLDMIKNELVHLLSLQPRPHSELSKSLPDDCYHDSGFEIAINQVGDYKKPTSIHGKGMYELKPELYSQFNPYFYHYTRADQSKAEEVQRKQKKQKNESQALPPPKPPAFTASFTRIIDLLTCDVMIYTIKLVLQRAVSKKSRSWSEMQLEKMLHIIGIALHEEERCHEQGIKTYNFVERASQGDPSIQGLLESLVNHSNIQQEEHKDLLSWVLQKFDKIKQLHDSSFKPGLFPKSTTDETLSKSRKKKADKAARRREKILSKMSAMQKTFISENAELFESTSTEIDMADMIRVGSEMDICVSVGEDVNKVIALGPNRTTTVVSPFTSKSTCILCQEDQEISFSDRAMVKSAFIQKSTVLSKNRGKILKNIEEYDPMFMSTDLFFGTHCSTCSHVMHADCWQRCYDNVIAKERRHWMRFRHHLSYDIDKFEYLCPYCKTLSNSVMPLIPQNLPTVTIGKDIGQEQLSYGDWLDGLQKTVSASVQKSVDEKSGKESVALVPCTLAAVLKMVDENVANNLKHMFASECADSSSSSIDESILDILKKFSSDVYKIGLGVDPDDENTRVPLMAWNTCAFTIMSMEQLFRNEGQSVFSSISTRQEDCLESLVRFAAVGGNVLDITVIKKHCLKLLSMLLCTDSYVETQQKISCILEIDMFHYFVSLCMSCPFIFADEEERASNPVATKLRMPSCDLGDLYLLKFVVTAHLVQIILSSDISNNEDSMELDIDDDNENRTVLEIYTHLRSIAGKELFKSNISAWNLLRHLREAVLPFLRCSALLFHFLSGVKKPDELLSPLPPREEYEALCQYLALPTDISQYFQNQGSLLETLVLRWCGDNKVRSLVQQQNIAGAKDFTLVTYPLSANQLVSLPHDYSELINRVSTFTCPNSKGDDSRAPTMCLICGEMLCSQSYCCQTEIDDSHVVGAATAHAEKCGSGTGLFLRVRECQILLLRNRTKGCFYFPPYLDNYGETDQGLRRGNPLKLCPERYSKLQRLWHSHSISEEIAHHMESNSSLISIEWNHL